MKAICINNINKHNYKEGLTINKIYNVVTKDNELYLDWYFFYDDNSEYCLCPKDWFLTISEIRKQKLEKIHQTSL